MLDIVKIKKVNATDAAIRAKAIPIKFISKLDKTKIMVQLRGLATFSSSVGIFKGVTNLDFLRIAARLKRPVPEFSENMKLLTKRKDHQGKYDVFFLPFINMTVRPSTPRCVSCITCASAGKSSASSLSTAVVEGHDGKKLYNYLKETSTL